MRSTYEIGEGDGISHLAPTGSAVKTLRKLRELGYDVPAEMNGPQAKQYTVALTRAGLEGK